MKKTYTTPCVAVSGTVVRETLGPIPGGSELDSKFVRTGAVGYYL